MMTGYGVVEDGGSAYSSVDEIVENSEKNDRDEAHEEEVSKLKSKVLILSFYSLIPLTIT